MSIVTIVVASLVVIGIIASLLIPGPGERPGGASLPV